MSVLTRRRLAQAGALATGALLAPVRAHAQTSGQSNTLKIGVMSDMSGPYAEATGLGDVLATKFAIEDFTKAHPDIKVDLVSADMLLKPDVGASIARSWYDREGVDAIFDIPQSAVALAVGAIAKEKDKVVVFTSAGVADLSGKFCTPNQVHWTFDLWGNANGVVSALVGQGAETWYFILPDYISGHAMTNDAVGAIAKEKDKVVVFTSAGVADLSGKFCTPNQVHWTFDLWGNANGVVSALVGQGAETWYFILPDYISGHAMTNDAVGALKRTGGREIGRAVYAFPGTTDFSSQLVQAKASGAKVICLANAGDDTANCIKQAYEFGIPQSGVKLACLVFQDYIVKSIGLETAQDLVGTMPWVWNMNPAAVAFAARFQPLYHGSKPNFYHAGIYSAVTHYLNAAAAIGVDKAKASGRAVVEQMKVMPVADPYYQGTVRADGKFVHNMYVWQTKTVAESKGPWDFFKLIKTIPTDEAFKPLAESGCPLVKA